MLSKFIKTSAVMLLSAQLAKAQTSSACNPVKGDKCPDDKAFGGTFTIDFTKGASKYFDVADGTNLVYDETKGAIFSIGKETDAPTITSNKYLFFGQLEVVMQAAPGTGVVSSVVLESDDLDEIDWEWLGGDEKQVQTNYFSKGDTTTYDRGGYSPVSNPQTSFHTYTIDWSPEAVVWSIDGTVVRTLTSASAGKKFPQTPMQIKLGTWDGGSSTSPTGTVQWAGGYTKFGSGSGAPYEAYYKTIKVTDKSNGVSGATAYAYGDTSGDYTSIKVKTDGTSDSSSSSSSSSSSAAATSSKATSTKAGTGAASATGSTSATAASGSATSPSTLMTTTTGTAAKATGTSTHHTTGTAATSGTATSTSASASSSPATVVTNGVAKVGANVFGAAAAALAAFALL